jgi:hypothetical protein
MGGKQSNNGILSFSYDIRAGHKVVFIFKRIFVGEAEAA